MSTLTNRSAIFCVALCLTSAMQGYAQNEVPQPQTSDERPATNNLVDAKRIDAALKDLVENQGLVGVSALIFEKGREVYFNAFGYADREAKRPMKRDTIAYIYSMTKPITGVALMQLVEDEKLTLDRPLGEIAPEFANLRVYLGNDKDGHPIYEAPKRKPTLRDITRHTAGFSRGAGNDLIATIYGNLDPMSYENTLDQMAKKLGKVPLGSHPGEQWRYGDSVDVQAFIVQRTSNMPFDEYIRKRIFEPLGMHETAYYLGPEFDHRRTRIYQRNSQGRFEIESAEAIAFNRAPRPMNPGGYGLLSTVDDYMRFARMLLNEGELDGQRILEPETVKLMATNALPATLKGSNWLPSKGQVGFGIDFAVRISSPASPDEASGEIGEFFWDGRASTLFWVDPRNQIAAVLFTQMVPFNTLPVHKTFRDAVYWDDQTAAARFSK